MNKELFNDYINGLSISELSNKYKISKTRVYKDIAEYSKIQGKVINQLKTFIKYLELNKYYLISLEVLKNTLKEVL